MVKPEVRNLVERQRVAWQEFSDLNRKLIVELDKLPNSQEHNAKVCAHVSTVAIHLDVDDPDGGFSVWDCRCIDCGASVGE